MEDFKTTFGTRFRSLRIGYGYTQDTLCEAYTLKTKRKLLKSSISQYENGKQIPEIPELISFAKFFDVTVDYLLGLSDVMISNFVLTIKDLEKVLNKLSDNDKLLAKPYIEKLYKSVYGIDLTNNNNEFSSEISYTLKEISENYHSNIKILGQTAAGQPLEYGDTITEDISNLSDVPANANFALTVNGDSMEPQIKNGSIIYIHSQEEVENGTISIIEINGAVTCKKVYKENNQLKLVSLNEKYEPIIIEKGNVRILGKVIL